MVSEVLDFVTPKEVAGAVARAVPLVQAGHLIVLPTDTVYGIGADAFSPHAVDALLTAKGRGREKPSPVLIADVSDAQKLAASINDEAQALMDAMWPGALTIVLPAREQLGWDLGETGGTVALRVPNFERTRDLLRFTGPLAVSSANLTGHPAALSAHTARAQLGDNVSLYLDAGDAPGAVPSTIVTWDESGMLHVLRHGAISDEQIQAAIGHSVRK
ncbi:MAG: L-threonylcarbamoyladenylate synthase [Actinomycetaceae bacterium]|nr:L-threonylcarbamoyladenylate synthase [Actinomycetaceae bacterium]MDY6082761.1 L-threonylcarbamoyladenylate synthase [Actinomycetaceae bacterium]